MLLGNNIVNWLMCPLHVDVISALRNIKSWYLTNLFSVGTGDKCSEGRGKIPHPRTGY